MRNNPISDHENGGGGDRLKHKLKLNKSKYGTYK